LPWCKNQPKTVAVPRLTAKILCQKHNSDLSDVDAAGASAFRVLQDAAALNEARRKLRPRRWKQVRFEIDGRRLERWFLKTLINVGTSRSASGVCALSGSPLATPPRLFIDVVFGLSELQRPLGLYAAAAVGETVTPRDALELRTLLDQAGTLAGALFTFIGLRFFLNLQAGQVPYSFPLPAGHGWLNSGALYHIARLNTKVAGKLSHYVQFLWSLP
jgi:hypothetical protein